MNVHEERCRSKVRYSSLEEAARRASLDELATYKCRVCDGFHLTKSAQGPDDRERAKRVAEYNQKMAEIRERCRQKARRLRMQGGRRRK